MTGIIDKVKPLNWKEGDSFGDVITAKGVGKTYEIIRDYNDTFKIAVDGAFRESCQSAEEARTKCFALHIGDLLPFLEI